MGPIEISGLLRMKVNRPMRTLRANRSLIERGGSAACKFLKPRAVLAAQRRNDAMSPSACDSLVIAEAEAISEPFV